MAKAREKKGRLVRELNRSMAQRGKLPPLYQALSDHYTAILQKLWPVWALIGPGLSDPGHIELRSRNVALDSEELLGTEAELRAGKLPRRKVLGCLGVAFHEVMHAKHTKLWVMDRDEELLDAGDDASRQVFVDRRLMEEPRMEANGVREFPATTVRGKFVRGAVGVAVVDHIIRVFLKQVAEAAMAGQPVTRDMAGRAMTYLWARTHYGVIQTADLAALEPIWRSVLGNQDFQALDDLYARLIWLADGDNDGLTRFAEEYREIIGPPDPPPPGGHGDGMAQPGQAGGHSQGGGDPADGDGQGGPGTPAGDGDEDGEQVGAGSLADALEQALGEAAEHQLEQLNEDISLDEVLAGAETAATSSSSPESGGRGTGRPTGRMPDRGVNRPPAADEVQAAKKYANRLRQALTLGTRRIDKRTPGGRFNSRAYMAGRAQRSRGEHVTAQPWTIQRNITNPIEEPHVGLIIDTSGSMGFCEYALGPISWIVQTGLREVDGRMAASLFGNGCELLTDGKQPMKLVPGIRTGGGTAFAGDAVELVCEHLEMDNEKRPRFLYILSDGGWYDTEAGLAKIRWLREQGVPTIHISIGMEPLSVEADRIVVIDDPADALDIIARDTVEALKTQGNRGQRRPALV